MISSMTDDEAEDAAIVENLHRKDVAPLEEAEAYSRLIERVEMILILWLSNSERKRIC